MDFDEYMKRFNSVIEQLTGAEGLRIMTTLAFDAQAKVVNRQINTGVMASGKKYTYSKNPMLVNRTSFVVKSGYNTIAGTKEKRKELDWVTIKKGTKIVRLFVLTGGYSQFRDLQGRQTEFVDFSLTGRLWKNVNVLPGSVTAVEAVIGASEEINKKILEGLGARFEKVLNLSQKEKTDLTARHGDLVAKVFHNNGL